MDLVQVNSTNLAAIGYDKTSKTLRIRFVEGSTYEYYGVPAKLHRELMQSDSKGSFFQENVVNQFAFQKVNLEKESHMKNKQQLAAEERAKAAAPNAAQPAVEKKEPKQETKPATPAPAAEQPASKQQTTIMRLIVALREQRKIEVKPEQLVQDGKFINVMLGKEWPTIRVGTSGGITVMELRSYASAFDAAIKGDELLAKQNGRDAKKQASAPAAAAPQAPAAQPKAETPTPTAKKQKAHAELEKQLATA